MNIDSILQQLRSERDRIDTAIRALEGSGSGTEPKRRGRKPNALKQAQGQASGGSGAPKRRRVLSAEARKRMSEAAKRRWAERGKGK